MKKQADDLTPQQKKLVEYRAYRKRLTYIAEGYDRADADIIGAIQLILQLDTLIGDMEETDTADA